MPDGALLQYPTFSLLPRANSLGKSPSPFSLDTSYLDEFVLCHTSPTTHRDRAADPLRQHRSECDAVKFILNRFVESLTDPVGLRVLDFRLRVFNVLRWGLQHGYCVLTKSSKP